jgi:hypothetical protein
MAVKKKKATPRKPTPKAADGEIAKKRAKPTPIWSRTFAIW